MCVTALLSTSIIWPVQKKLKYIMSLAATDQLVQLVYIQRFFELFLNARLLKRVKINKSQFTFIKDGCCFKILFTLQSAVEYFTEYSSTVYLASLDVHKVYYSANHY